MNARQTLTQAQAQAPAQTPAPAPAPASPAKAPSLWREAIALLIKIAVIVLTFALLFTFAYGIHRSMEPGMNPAVKDGDLVITYRLDKKYAIGDLLLLEFKGETQVRRVVAGAGDVVDITESGLVINGALQQEPNIYQKTQPYDGGISFPVTVGPGQVFVLGDARENATDSRVYGPVNTKDTQGTAISLIRRRHL
ncbi:MAG: signal peptidase I [Coriobacteriia bacterium]|nr:signal peptidase I [Coriobacteriia bacterium]